MSYRSTNYFKPGVSNTICDVTGFKRKTDEVVQRWEGYQVIPEAYHRRHPQDFPPNILKPKTYEDVRFEQVDGEDNTLVYYTDVMASDGAFYSCYVEGYKSTIDPYVVDSQGNRYKLFYTTTESFVI